MDVTGAVERKKDEAENSFGSGLNFVNALFIAFVTNCSRGNFWF